MERYNITVKENPFDGCPYADMVVSDDGAYMRYDDAQRALDAERADNAMAREAYWATIADLRSELATLQAQLVAEQQRADRAVKDRSDVLYVKTKEGLSCSEWLMRTAIAERKAKDLEAQLRQAEGEVTALRAENARLREALEAIADGPGTNGYCTQYERYMVELAQAALTPAAGGTRHHMEDKHMTTPAGQRQWAERATAALDAMTVNVYPRDSREWNESVILAAMEWAHQEALREASDLIKLMPMLTAHNVAAVLDRLAREAQINCVMPRN